MTQRLPLKAANIQYIGYMRRHSERRRRESDRKRQSENRNRIEPQMRENDTEEKTECHSKQKT